ncbi:Squalene synthase HpnC [Planctomycetales bacterium 10988]|nr:Squalene synthase HpnC [Planctomycetales bacterium 10988]
MASYSFRSHLKRYGPEARYPQPSLDQAFSYCQQLALSHYENFAVVNHLVPSELRRYLYPIYAYCRWADDLADEVEEIAESLAFLDWWEQELKACFSGTAKHPVMVALLETIQKLPFEQGDFLDLLTAFRQDQQTFRYDTPQEVADYCRFSANPVGRMILHLAGYSQEDLNTNHKMLTQSSDLICTGLQLVNFLQDVPTDLKKGRIYLPGSTMENFGVNEKDLSQQKHYEAMKGLLAEEADRAECYFLLGLEKISTPVYWLRRDMEFFARCGLAVLENLKKHNYNIWLKHLKISGRKKLQCYCSASLRAYWNSSAIRQSERELLKTLLARFDQEGVLF